MQTTIQKAVSTSGIGLHTGCQVSLTLRPAPEHTGIVFRRTDLGGFKIEAHLRWISRVLLATTLMKRGVMLSTVEHLLSAVYGLGVDNLYIDIDSLEIPILDGSSLPFVEMIQQAGIRIQQEPRRYLKIVRADRWEDGEKSIAVEPSNCFQISYEIHFPHPSIGRQIVDWEITPETYAREIGFARTFGFYAEVEQLLKKGLIRGGSFDNAVVLSEEGIMNGPLRAPDEFARHKAVDLIGDVALCGRPLLGRIIAHKAGHALHTELATRLVRDPSLCRVVSEHQPLTTQATL